MRTSETWSSSPTRCPSRRTFCPSTPAAGREALLFPAATDGEPPQAPATFYEVYYPAREGAGRKDLGWHHLRHAREVLAAQTGVTLAELMGRLGHTTPGAAMRCPHAAADRDAEIARVLSALAEGRGEDR